ncbi:sensor histidine kinase [Polaribacter sp. Hel1_85]|uniref:sensor histidine kinase n=1 Tax=Polaribacter sp. Hel1_85 TaxID=1250005 RepID=UPI00052C7CDB|nr:histidine kinase [Polaribacter sp. Hel1_85]KGL58966.1 two-component system sensor protein histidine kinase [Polaribacter sp. Hel1_85]
MKSKLNKTDYLVVVIFYSISTILNIIDYKSRNLNLIEYFVDIPTTIITSFIVIIIFMSFLIPKYLIHKKYFAFIFISLVVLTFFGTIADTLGFLSGGNSLNKLPKWYRIILNGIYTSSNDIGFLLGILFVKKFYEGKTELFKVEKKQKENELKLLRSQIDPHFLFNNLNTLDSLIDSDPKKAKEYINRLSLIYRYLIKTKDAEVMELSNEIEFAKNYIFLIKTRFGDDYEFTIKENITLEDKFIPTGAIQTLLENVVKHNKLQNRNVIKTTITINDGWLIVTNSKSEINSKEESFGTGLENLKARYQLLSDKKIQVHNMAKKFEVFIPIITLSE